MNHEFVDQLYMIDIVCDDVEYVVKETPTVYHEMVHKCISLNHIQYVHKICKYIFGSVTVVQFTTFFGG